MIDTIYEVVKTILNKEVRGHVAPADFNVIAKQVQEEIYREYFEAENRDKNKRKLGYSNRGFANLEFVQRQRIEDFSKTATLTFSTPNFVLPADLYLIKENGIVYNGVAVIQEVEGTYATYLAGSLGSASASFPIYTYVGNGLIKVLPASIVTGVTCDYVRTLADPKWTYTEVGGVPLFNPSAVDYQDFELHVSEFNNITIRILSYLGVNIRDEQVVQYAEILKQKLDTKDES